MGSSLTSMESLSRNFQLMIQKCRAYPLSEVFLSSIVYKTIKLSLLGKMFALLQSLCTNEGGTFIDNCNIWGWDILCKDGLVCLTLVRIFLPTILIFFKSYTHVNWKTMINDPWRVLKVSWKLRIPTIYNSAVIYRRNLLSP